MADTTPAAGRAATASAAAADVVAVVGSPRRHGNTSTLVDAALAELRRQGLTCEKLMLCDYSIGYCLGHDDCGELPACPVEDDAALVIGKAYAARALLLATPVYSDNVSGQMKVFMDRCCHNYAHEIKLAAEVVGLLCAAESTGLDATIDCLRRFVAHRAPRELPEYTMAGYACRVGDARRDGELLNEAARLGREMAEILTRCG